MKKFIGTKVIKAMPMTMVEAQKVLGREIKPATKEDDGYLVEYKDGYKSWSPKSVFEEAYKPAETFLDRMETEYTTELDRYSKGKDFIDSVKFNELPTIVGAMLYAQNSIQNEYLGLLKNRICLAKNKPMENSLSFDVAIHLLKAGYAIRRAGWNGKGMFVIKQIPAHITGDIIPNMQSLPQSAKDILMSRDNPHIDYTNQMLIVNTDGRADSWVPSSSDVFAEDWEVAEN